MLYDLNFSKRNLDLLSFFVAENPSRTVCRTSQTVETCAMRKKISIKSCGKFVTQNTKFKLSTVGKWLNEARETRFSSGSYMKFRHMTAETESSEFSAR